MKIVIQEPSIHSADLRTVIVEYDETTRSKSRVILRIGTYAGAILADGQLTHQEARAVGHALLSDADRAQKELEG